MPKVETNAKTMSWLPDMDLNHDKQIQNLLCYRYTIGQTTGEQTTNFVLRVKKANR